MSRLRMTDRLGDGCLLWQGGEGFEAGLGGHETSQYVELLLEQLGRTVCGRLELFERVERGVDEFLLVLSEKTLQRSRIKHLKIALLRSKYLE